ncbi:MAG TPA: M28 family peptidase [Candidatus Dormibacteraeota bacterium]
MVQPAWSRGIADEVSPDRLLEVTGRISEVVRLSGSAQELRSARYVDGLLREAGLKTQLLFHDAYISLPGAAELVVGEQRFPCITHSFSAPSGPGGIVGPLVDIRAPAGAAGYAAYGKVALLDGLAMAGFVSAVEAGGAVAQIYINGDLTHEMIVSSVWGSPGTAEQAKYPKRPVVSVTNEVGAKLRDLLRSGPVEIRVFCDVDTAWRKTPLLIANLKAAAGDDFVLFSGHLDSWHRGAMDNAGANATMVEVARILAGHRRHLRRGLRLAFWSGHSHGRYSGSAWYADSHWSELREHCVAHVNVDSVGGRGATVLSEGIAMASTRALGADAVNEVAHAAFHGTRVGRAGDQSFVALGIPSLWMSLSEQPPSDHPTARAFSSAVGSPRSGGLGWWWHTVEDTVDKLDPELLLRDAQIYTVAVGKLVSEALLPLSAVGEADDLVRGLIDLDEVAGGRFDLSTTIAAAREARAVASRLDDWRAKQPLGQDLPQAALFNRAVNALLRGLVGAQYSEFGPYAQDPAAGIEPIPLLNPVVALVDMGPDTDEARLLTVDLIRARNRLEDLVRRGTQAADTVVEQLR